MMLKDIVKGTNRGAMFLVIGLLFSTGAYADGSRSVIRYSDANSILILDKQFEMDGFRFLGNYSKKSSINLIAPSYSKVSFNTNSTMTTPTQTNWYATFACGDTNGSSPTFKIMPFLRVNTVSGNQITFMQGGEMVSTVSLQSYSWGTAPTGVDVLVINETIDGRTHAFSGRIAKSTGASATSLTLDSIGGITQKDYLLPAPSGCLNYRYLGSFYYDTAGVRNIADSGALVKAKMVELGVTNELRHALYRSPVDTSGYINPLATAIVIDTQTSLQTNSSGDVAEYFDTDGSGHVVASSYHNKTISGATDSFVVQGVTIPFAFSQQFYLTTGGSLQANRDYVNFYVTGWIEP